MVTLFYDTSTHELRSEDKGHRRGRGSNLECHRKVLNEEMGWQFWSPSRSIALTQRSTTDPVWQVVGQYLHFGIADWLRVSRAAHRGVTGIGSKLCMDIDNKNRANGREQARVLRWHRGLRRTSRCMLPPPSLLPHVNCVEIEVRTDVLGGLEGRSESNFGTMVTWRSAAKAVQGVGRAIWDQFAMMRFPLPLFKLGSMLRILVRA